MLAHAPRVLGLLQSARLTASSSGSGRTKAPDTHASSGNKGAAGDAGRPFESAAAAAQLANPSPRATAPERGPFFLWNSIRALLQSPDGAYDSPNNNIPI